MTYSRRGFTLIELLVVISIIGLLASVVLASLSTAREKARDGAVKSMVNQYAILLELEQSDTGSYTALQRGWFGTTPCSGGGFSGAHAAKARELCAAIVEESSNGAFNSLYFGTNGDNVNRFSIMAYLPGKKTYYCRGSSGKNSDDETGNDWGSPGCYANP